MAVIGSYTKTRFRSVSAVLRICDHVIHAARGNGGLLVAGCCESNQPYGSSCLVFL
jgi:hypothetical protein